MPLPFSIINEFYLFLKELQILVGENKLVNVYPGRNNESLIFNVRWIGDDYQIKQFKAEIDLLEFDGSYLTPIELIRTHFKKHFDKEASS